MVVSKYIFAQLADQLHSLLKNHLNMNQPKTKPDTKRSEYHLSENEPILKISGLTCQCIARKSNISIKIYDKPANVGIFWKFGTIIYRTGRTGFGLAGFGFQDRFQTDCRIPLISTL